MNNTWIPVKTNVKLSSIGLKAHFEEEVDIEARYLHNLETSFHSKEIEQMNMIGELMAVMRHDEINPITPILAHLDEHSRFNWSWTNYFSNFTSFFTSIPLFIIIFAIYVIYNRNRNSDSSQPQRTNITINPMAEEPPAIQRSTWTVSDLLANISRVKPRLSLRAPAPPPPNPTPTSKDFNDSITHNITPLQQNLPESIESNSLAE